MAKIDLIEFKILFCRATKSCSERFIPSSFWTSTLMLCNAENEFCSQVSLGLKGKGSKKSAKRINRTPAISKLQAISLILKQDIVFIFIRKATQFLSPI